MMNPLLWLSGLYILCSAALAAHPPIGNPPVVINPGTPKYFVIKGTYLTDACLYYVNNRVTDHRTTPPTTTIIPSATLANCKAADPARGYANMAITYSDGSDWSGTPGKVQIRLVELALCLEIPQGAASASPRTQPTWSKCTFDKPESGSDAAAHQYFDARINNQGDIQLAYFGGEECLAYTANNYVYRADCDETYRWAFVPPR